MNCSKSPQFAQEAAGHTADLIWGYNQDIALGKKINVTIIATGFETNVIPELYVQEPKKKKVVEIKKENKKKEEQYFESEKTYTDDIDFEVEYTNEEMNLVSKPFNQKNVTDDFTEDEEEISFIETSKTKQNKKEGALDEEERVKKALERMKLMESMKQQKTTNKNVKVERSAKTIDELENEPAYKRRNIEINHENSYNKNKEVSKYTLSDDDDDDLSEDSFHDDKKKRKK